jgi:hypothetical protein
MKSHTHTMIIEQKTNSVISQGIKGSVSFGIKQDGLAHIFNVLRNQLYSDKILAVLREYSCNAVDAHTEAGISNTPIRVTLPTLLSPELKIRDFGAGLTDTEIKDIYAFYGESTKRKSNALIGQLGLGSKSAFAYGDNFLINSYVNSKKTSYNAFIDDSQVGQIAKMMESNTTEPNGIEIVIPVKSQDIPYFKQKAQHLFRFFPVRPQIVGDTDFTYEKEEEVLYRNSHGLFRKNSRSYGSKNSVAIMGCIGYSLNPSSMQLDNEKEDDRLCYRLLNSVGAEFFFDIGELDIAASREGLQYTEKTINSLKKKIVSFHDELCKYISDSMASAPSFWSCGKSLGNLSDSTHPFSAIASSIKKITWKGKSVSAQVCFEPEENVSMYVPRWTYSSIQNARIISGGKLTQQVRNVQLSENIIFIENTKKMRSGVINYAFNFLKDSQNVLVVSFDTLQKRSAFMQKYGIAESDFIDIKTLNKIILPRATRRTPINGSSVPLANRSKHSKNVFILQESCQTRSWIKTKSECWEEESIDLRNPSIANDYAWVEINRFMPVLNGREWCGTQLLKALTMGLGQIAKICNAKIKIPKIIGIKTKATDITKSTKIKHISDFVKEELLKLEKAHSFGEKLWGIELYNELHNENAILIETITNFGQAKNAEKAIQDIRNLKTDSTLSVLSANELLTNMFGFKAKDLRKPASPKIKTIKDNYDKVNKVYELIKFIDTFHLHNYRNDSRKCKDAIRNYLEYMDKELDGQLEKV